MEEIYWDVQFKHRDRKAGKDRAYTVAGAPDDAIGVLAKALEKATSDGLSMNGEFRVYVYVLKQ